MVEDYDLKIRSLKQDNAELQLTIHKLKETITSLESDKQVGQLLDTITAKDAELSALREELEEAEKRVRLHKELELDALVMAGEGKEEIERLRDRNAVLTEAARRLLNVIGFGFAQQQMFAKEYLQLESALRDSGEPAKD